MMLKGFIFSLAAVLLPSASFAEFSMTYLGRTVVGVPVSSNGTHSFVLCAGLPVSIPDGAEFVYTSELKCEYKNLVYNSGADAADTPYIPPRPTPIILPCVPEEGPTPSPNYDSPELQEYIATIDTTLGDLAIRELGVANGEGLTGSTYMGQAASQDNFVVSVNTDFSSTYWDMVETMERECDDPKPKPNTGCPGCAQILDDFFQENTDWHEKWWEPDSPEMLDFYNDIGAELGSSDDRAGIVLGDELLLRQALMLGIVSGGYVGGISAIEAE